MDLYAVVYVKRIDILALSTAHDDVTAKDIGSGLVNNATESVEQVGKYTLVCL